MPKKKAARVMGVVEKALPNAEFIVRLDKGGARVTAHLAGRLHLYHIKVLQGDQVTVELSPKDPTRARIIYRIIKQP